jgi:hypothetical protein
VLRLYIHFRRCLLVQSLISQAYNVYLHIKIVLPGNKIEVQSSNLLEGQTVEVVIIISEPDAYNSEEVNKNSSFS